MVQMKGFNPEMSKKQEGPPKNGNGTSDGSKKYGVKNYLTQFYRQQPSQEELEDSGWYLLPARPQNARKMHACRACSIVGLLLMLLGAAGTVIGYTWPKPRLQAQLSNYYFEDDTGDYFKVPQEELVTLFRRDPMQLWKLIGLGTFTLGGALLAVSLLVQTLCTSCASVSPQGQGMDENQSILVFPAHLIAESDPAAPVVKKVPLSEQVAQIQPQEAGGGEKRRVSEDELLMMSE